MKSESVADVCQERAEAYGDRCCYRPSSDETPAAVNGDRRAGRPGRRLSETIGVRPQPRGSGRKVLRELPDGVAVRAYALPALVGPDRDLDLLRATLVAKQLPGDHSPPLGFVLR